MQVLVCEYLCATASPELPASLAMEGRAMLSALVEDLAQLPGVHVKTLWSESLGPPPFSTGVEVQHIPPDSPAYIELLQSIARDSEAAILIAPECDGLLAEHHRWIAETQRRWIGSNLSAISLCTDKLELAEHLVKHAVAVVPTEVWQAEEGQADKLTYPLVIKPRDGAGSQATYLIRSTAHYRELEATLLAEPLLADRAGRTAISQPFISGQAVSVALLIDSATGVAISLPACEQRLSSDGRFHYFGGIVPARIGCAEEVQTLALAACRKVPGLGGYVGVDLLVPDRGDRKPIVVEINPRLTTSYLGYRQLCEDNLAEWLLNSWTHSPRWCQGPLQFDADGTIHR